MKPRKGSKTNKAAHPRRKVKSKSRTNERKSPPSRTLSDANPSASTRISNARICEEVEVGDLGGFGSAEELEAHEKSCGQEATEVCHTCGRNLCSSHYELLHKDHDYTGWQNTRQSLASR